MRLILNSVKVLTISYETQMKNKMMKNKMKNNAYKQCSYIIQSSIPSGKVLHRVELYTCEKPEAFVFGNCLDARTCGLSDYFLVVRWNHHPVSRRKSAGHLVQR